MSRLLVSIAFIICIASAQTGCSPVPLRESADSLFLITDNLEIYYNLKKVNEKHFLPYVLSEVSALTFLNENRMLMVEDEKGKVYEYDLNQKKILNKITFGSAGDFEGVEYINDTVYVLESDGDIHQFSHTEGNDVNAHKTENALGKKNDTEGLGYDPITNSLLIACKEDGSTKTYQASGKTIYTYNLNDQKLDSLPIIDLSAMKMKRFFEANRDFDYDEKRIKFEPSGIAYNPVDGYFYILASVGKMLIVVDRKGKIMGTYPIAPRILSQPEGIAFNPKGDLYISSEGEGDKGYIVKFEMKRR